MNRPALTDELQLDLARPAHLVALLDEERVLAVPERLELHEHARKGRGRRPGRRVLRDAEARREHAGAEARAGARRLPGIDVGRRRPAVAERLPEGVSGRSRASNDVEAGHRHEIEGHPGGMAARHVAVEADFASVEAEGRR